MIMGAEAPPGSKSGARAHSGAPGTWEVSSPPHASGQRALRKLTRGLREPRVERAGAQAEHEHDAHTGYRRAKETKLEAASRDG